MKTTVQIEDTLQDHVDNAISSVKDELLSHLEQNPDMDETPNMGNDLDYFGAIHEIIDGSVPIYTAEIRDIFYLHGDEVEEAFDIAGIGNKDDKCWPTGWKAAAIYCYIEQEVAQWYHNNAEEIFTEWREKQTEKNI